MNVTPRTMEIAAEMIRLGASPNTIAENVFENKPFAAQKLLGRALDSLQCSPDCRIVWAHVTQANFQEFGATDEATEGVVNAVRSVQGAEVALFFREMPSGRLRIRCARAKLRCFPGGAAVRRRRPPAGVRLHAGRPAGGGGGTAGGRRAARMADAG